ncbi:MAG TPA: GAF domain-containing sensor histidine kinase, partial [Bacteroidota bacterium]
DLERRAHRAPGTVIVGSRVRDLETILNVVRKINTSLVPSDVLELVVDEAIRITRAERGFLMLADPQGTLEFAVGRTALGESIDASTVKVSSTVLEDVFSTGESLCIENALHDERYERRESVMSLELQTILCAPLKTVEETIGVIYVDSTHIQRIDRADILNLFEILAGQAAIAIKNARLYEDLRKAYDDLGQANEQLVRFERMATRGEMTSEISHELKNMVGIAMLSLELLQRKLPELTPEQVGNYVDRALKSTQKIAGFSEALQTRAHPAAKFVAVSPNRVIAEFVDFVRAIPKFRRNIVTLSLAEGLPSVSVDVDQITQVLLNLFMNAIHARPDVALRISTALDQEAGCVRLTFSDNGPGIDPAVRERLFKEKVTTKPNGHGCGLRICQQIMNHHGGAIALDSAPGQGASFVLSFPLPGPTIN